jgi:hypothetical protein
VVGVWKNSMIVRVGSDSYDEALLEPQVKEFDITGKPMKGWLMVEPQGVDDDRHCEGLDSACVEVRREAAR